MSKFSLSRWLTDGNGQIRETAKPLLREVFLEQVHHEPDISCWWFRGGFERREQSHGYRVVSWLGGHESAHRLSYRLFKGEVPKGMVVMHSCDTPPCVNPEHLSIGTQAANMADKMRKGRHRGNGYERKTHCPQGHEYVEENIYWFEGRRYCRSCHYQYTTRWNRNQGYQERSDARKRREAIEAVR